MLKGQKDPIAFVNTDKPHLWYNHIYKKWVCFVYVPVHKFDDEGMFIFKTWDWVRYAIGENISDCWEDYRYNTLELLNA